MDEGRKRTLLIAASILAARRLATLDTRQLNSPAAHCAIADSITMAQRIMAAIDERYSQKERK